MENAKKFWKKYIGTFVGIGFLLIFICSTLYFIDKYPSSSAKTEKNEEITYAHCDEIMLFYPDGTHEYIYLNYDSKVIINTRDNPYKVVYNVDNPKGVNVYCIAIIENGTLHFKEPKDYYTNDDTTYSTFSGTFYIDNLN